MAKKARDWLKKEMNNSNKNPGGKSIDELLEQIIQSIQRIPCTTINRIEKVNKQLKENDRLDLNEYVVYWG